MHHENVTCHMTETYHEMESEELALVNVNVMVITGACCFAIIQHKEVVV
jgi:hypothetical protein